MLLTVVDAFTDRAFAGNPAAVAIVDEFPSDDRMQLIAREMNLSETAFVVRSTDGEHALRWFTPTVEVDLCGHATLAAAHLLGDSAVFTTHAGRLSCTVRDGWVEMDFPAWAPVPAPLPALPDGVPPPEWTGIAGDDWLIELPTEHDVTHRRAQPSGTHRHRPRRRAHGRRRRQSRVRAERGDRRGSRHRLSPLCARALLGTEARSPGADRPSGLLTRRHRAHAPRRRAGGPGGPGDLRLRGQPARLTTVATSAGLEDGSAQVPGAQERDRVRSIARPCSRIDGVQVDIVQ